ncbi:MAG: hypothetical protein ACE362_10955 [Phaeodactylibacter xiamenensis]|uniref:Uncharacterized protein n=1 Tax=Phaeodactylibacter xiamenensis TaxID=1524460 RepID=A0A098S771_9BACT|nr:hypothetical protein [Phaeodactylibacter xiamenensis]KGE86952.1 hypothetical protein IX84_18080 [Phaeodactylibacter xiamenensis]MCR9050554.1 hypothetical protein [bacterium]
MKRTLMTVDALMQFLLMVSCLIYPFTLFAAFFLGIWQLSSSLLKGLIMQSWIHIQYFLAAAMYCVLLIAAAKFGDQLWLSEWSGEMYLWIVLAVPPLIGAVWYFLRSIQDLVSLNEAPSEWV